MTPASIEIKSMTIKIEAQIQLDTKGLMVKQEASVMHIIKGGLVMRNHSTDKVDLSVAYELIGHPSMHAPVDVLYTLTRHAGEVSAAHGRKRRSIDTRSDAAHGVQFSLSQSRCGPLHERGEDYM
jgi:hypothetical protein